jgi:hypothetical protein
MPRTTIAAVLAMLLILAPAASAMPIDPVYSGPTAEGKAQLQVMPERITDHPVPPTSDEIEQALAQEQSYSTKGTPDVAALVREQESTSGSGNQGPVTASAPASVPAPADDDAPWLIVGLGIAAVALGAGALTVVARRNRTRARVAA